MSTENDSSPRIRVPFTPAELEKFRDYCKRNGLIAGQLIRRLAMIEVESRTSLMDKSYIPPLSESLKKTCRKNAQKKQK